MNVRVRPPASCHPERLHRAKGLCESCYNARLSKKRYLSGRRATCHPDRRLIARGLCPHCYRTQILKRPGAKERAYDLKKTFGLIPEQYEFLSKQQNDLCAICGGEQTRKLKKYLDVDHDHVTNEIRGLLCNNCNMGIGVFKDNPRLLRQAAEYLETYLYRLGGDHGR